MVTKLCFTLISNVYIIKKNKNTENSSDIVQLNIKLGIGYIFHVWVFSIRKLHRKCHFCGTAAKKVLNYFSFFNYSHQSK